MNSVMVEEYKFLRQELEMNRKFVFERPLLIVGATLAGALSPRVGLLPIPFLGVLLFNLWFTFNRLWSSARIVAYVQLVHEGTNELEWIGWENALRRFRRTAFQLDKAAAGGGKAKETPYTYDPMGYYAPIFYFHLILGVGLGVLSLLLSTSPSAGVDPTAAATVLPTWLQRANIAALVLFGGAVIPFWPGKVRNSIERQRDVWKAALSPAKKLPAFFVPLSAVKTDPVLYVDACGARKLLVTDLYQSKELETIDDVWVPPAAGEKCPVQLMRNTEVALFTQRASQDRHYHRIGTEMYMVIEGRMRIEVGDKSYSLSPGDMIVVNPNAIHQVKPEGTEFLCRVVTANSGGTSDKCLV